MRSKNHTLHIAPHTSQKGITLIALIITIIVMLILVGVTVNVALNGGLFEKGEKAAYQTQASTVKEQLEIAKAVEIANRDGKLLDDYSGITVGNLEGLDAKTIAEYKDKILVAKNGDICYNPENVIDTEERDWLEEIGIKEYVNAVEPEKFKFTLGEIAPKATFEDSWIKIPANDFWKDTVSDELKNSTTTMTAYGIEVAVYENVVSSEDAVVNQGSNFGSESNFETGFILMKMEEEIHLHIRINNDYIENDNWSAYQNLEFTITL